MQDDSWMAIEAKDLLAPRRIVKRRSLCWLCGKPSANLKAVVGCDTPGGKPCKPKWVTVHLGCWNDMDD